MMVLLLCNGMTVRHISVVHLRKDFGKAPAELTRDHQAVAYGAIKTRWKNSYVVAHVLLKHVGVGC